MERLALYVQVVIGLLLLSSALPAFRKMGEHAAIIADYQMMPRRWAPGFAWLNAVAQCIAGACLLLGIRPELSLTLGSLLLGLYTVAIAVNLVRGRTEISCGCGGAVGSHALSWRLVGRNLLLLAAAVWAVFASARGAMSDIWSFEYGVIFCTAAFSVTVFATVANLVGIGAVTQSHAERGGTQ